MTLLKIDSPLRRKHLAAIVERLPAYVARLAGIDPALERHKETGKLKRFIPLPPIGRAC